MNGSLRFLDDKICAHVLSEVGAVQPDLASFLKFAIDEPTMTAEDAALFVSPVDAKQVLGIVAQVLARYGGAV